MPIRRRKRRARQEEVVGGYGYRGDGIVHVQGDCEVVTIPEPDGTGKPVTVRKLKVTRQIDALRELRLIDEVQHRVASDLRDLWTQAGISTLIRARSMGRVSGGEKGEVRNARAFARYNRAIKQVPYRERQGFVAVVIFDAEPHEYAKINPGWYPLMLPETLDKLGRTKI